MVTTKYLSDVRHAPKMYGSDKEALLAYCTGLVLGAGHDIDVVGFYSTHLEVNGNSFVGLSDPFDEHWAQTMVDHICGLIAH